MSKDHPTEDQQVKPCPFCGSEKAPRALHWKDIDEDSHCDAANYAVCCQVGDGGCGAVSGYDRTRKAAKARWNQRSAT